MQMWKKGQSGNPTGANTGKDRLFRQALMMELKRKGSDLPELRKIARRMIDAAQGRKPRGKGPAYSAEFATKEIVDRLDGKSAQPIVGSSNEPIVVELNYSGRALPVDPPPG